MLSKICFYCNKIFVADVTYITAYSCKKNSKSENEKFQECLKIKVPLKYSSFAKDIRLDVVDNYIIGLKSLVILIVDNERLYKAFIFSNIFSKQIYEVPLPTWSASDANYFRNIYISNGPTFLYSSDSLLHLYSMPYGTNKKFDCQFLGCDMTQCKVLQFKCFDPFYNNSSDHYLSVLVTSSSNMPVQQQIKFFGFISEKNTSDMKCENLKLTFFFPRYFENLLKTLQVIKCISQFNKESSSINLKESASVLCTADECLVFENAVLKYCCKLPFSLMDVMCIKTELNNDMLNSKNLLIAVENKTVFLVKVLKNFNCQVVKHWTGIEVAISGDILMKGSKQILLFAQTDGNSWQQDCVLYDIVTLMPFDLLSNSVLPDNCLKSTISGVEKKVQVGLSAEKKIEHEISEKSAAIIDALAKMSEFKMNTENIKYSKILQESLVDLILSKDENRADNILLETKSSSVKLLEKRQYMSKQWIISMLFLNDGERSICNPSIKLLIEGRETTSMQKLFICQTDNSFLYSKCNRQINPNERFFVIVSAEVLALCEQEEITLVLTWYNGFEDEFDNEIFVNEDQKAVTQQQICTEMKISVDDVLNNQREKGISSIDDLLFARASQQRIGLSVVSLHSDISSLENFIMSTESETLDLHLFESSCGNCISINNEKSILFGTHLLLQNCKQNMAEMDVFVRNDNELCLLIHYLYHKLPEDTIIFPCNHFKDEYLKLTKNVVISMKSEIDLLISSFNIHNVSEELRKNYPKLMSSQKVGTISIPKAAYKRIRTVLVKKECNTDSVFKTVTSMCIQ